MFNRFFIIPAVLVALAGCSKEKEEAFPLREETPAPADESLILTVEASKSMDTKALALTNEGNTLTSFWADGEKVGVYRNGARIGQLTATVQSDNTKARLSGMVPKEGIDEGTTLMLLFPDREDLPVGSRWDYSGQNGTAPGQDLAAKYDYATVTLTVSSVSDTQITTTTPSVTFQNEQSVYRLDFKVENALKAVKWFSVSSTQKKLVTSRSYSGGWTSTYGDLTVSLTGAGAASPYLSLRNEATEADNYNFMVVGDDDALYTGSKAIGTGHLGFNKFLAPGVNLSKPSFAPPTGDTAPVITQSTAVY